MFLRRYHCGCAHCDAGVIYIVCFSQCKETGAFSVVMDNYVRDDDGTGVVHQAPYFGAVSHFTCIKGILHSEMEIL